MGQLGHNAFAQSGGEAGRRRMFAEALAPLADGLGGGLLTEARPAQRQPQFRPAVEHGGIRCGRQRAQLGARHAPEQRADGLAVGALRRRFAQQRRAAHPRVDRPVEPTDQGEGLGTDIQQARAPVGVHGRAQRGQPVQGELALAPRQGRARIHEPLAGLHRGGDAARIEALVPGQREIRVALGEQQLDQAQAPALAGRRIGLFGPIAVDARRRERAVLGEQRAGPLLTSTGLASLFRLRPGGAAGQQAEPDSQGQGGAAGESRTAKRLRGARNRHGGTYESLSIAWQCPRSGTASTAGVVECSQGMPAASEAGMSRSARRRGPCPPLDRSRTRQPARAQ